MRPIRFERKYLLYPHGSCLASYGETKVICTAVIEEGVPPFLKDTGKGWVTAEYAMLPGSTAGGRRKREFLKADGRSTEIRRLIGRSLRACVHLDRIGPVTITVDCDVIQADGGTRTVAISGGWIALYDALRVLAGKSGAAAGSFVKGQVGAVSVGYVGGELVCDLDYDHDSRADVDMNVVRLDDSLIEVQGTGEGNVFSRRQLGAMLDSAFDGIDDVFASQRDVLGADWEPPSLSL